jgi:hypothetical protein
VNLVTANFGDEEAAMQAYFRDGTARAAALNFRGPLRFTADGKLDPAILKTYDRYGFYVFSEVFGGDELTEVRASILDMLDRVPVTPDAAIDSKGRPALGADRMRPTILWSKPLGDPFGGGKGMNGRAPVGMPEPDAAKDIPAQVPIAIAGVLQYSEPTLRLYGHPQMMAAVAAINGDDFVPQSEVLIVKRAGEGGSYAWHQDGTTHWDSPAWDPGVHGINLMPHLFDGTAANGLWCLPGSHKTGRQDIVGLTKNAGSVRLPEAVPMICKAGDVLLTNRQILHASFPNTSKDPRLSFVFSYHRRGAVLDVHTRTAFGDPVTYDAARVQKKCEIIGYSIVARQKRFPGQTSYVYRPHAESGEHYSWEAAGPGTIKNYHTRDLFL